ncbi:Ig-like domain-containing protein [Microvirga sp. GCM10011540]|uniref:Ig-like domain-containing protein n=1 Tax=Microvirga sp. GCM10011540 TaxID=3317338 RepID=UPI00360C34D0
MTTNTVQGDTWGNNPQPQGQTAVARPGEIGTSWVNTRGDNLSFLVNEALSKEEYDAGLRGHFEYNTGDGVWHLVKVEYYSAANSGVPSRTNGGTAAPLNATVRYVDDRADDTATAQDFHLRWDPSTSTNFFISPDLEPSNIEADTNHILANSPSGTILATLTPTDSKPNSGGYWEIESQSVPGLFQISPTAEPGDTLANLIMGSSAAVVPGQTVSVTVKYYDQFQRESDGDPISGSGYSKTLTFTVAAETSQDLNFSEDFSVSTTEANDQSNAAMATLSNGNFIAVWQSHDQDVNGNAAHSIQAQIFTAEGSPVGIEIPVTATGNDADEITPAVAALEDGNFVIAYAKGSNGGDYDIAFRVVSSSGGVGSEVVVHGDAGILQHSPAVTMLHDGSFVITWVSDGFISAQKISGSDGSLIGPELKISAGEYDANPSIAALSNGDFVVAWGDAGTGNIYAALGSNLANTIVVSDAEASWGVDFWGGRPSAVGLSGGGFVVAWDSYTQDGESADVQFQLFDNTGLQVGGTRTANVNLEGYKFSPDLSALPAGGFVLAWQSSVGDYDMNGIFGRRFDSSGNATDPSEFEINQYRRGDQTEPVISAFADGRFGTIWTDASSDGTSAGIEGRVLLLEVVLPAAPSMPDLMASSDSGQSNTDNVTAATTTIFSGTAGDAEAGATITLYDTDGTIVVATTVVENDGSWSATSSLLAEGTHTITAKVVDSAGNESPASGGLTVTIDRTVPSAPQAPVLAAASDSGSSSTDSITNVSVPTFSGGAGSIEAGAVVRLYDTDGTTVIATTTANGDGSWSVAANALSEGAHTITARATDLAGNTSAASSDVTVTIDRTAPATVVASAAFSADTGASSTDMVTSSAVQTVSGMLSANLTAGERVEVSLDNGATWGVATADGSTWSLAATLSGSGILQVRVIDAAGNAGAAYSHAYVLDTNAPVAPPTPDLDAASDTGSSDSDNITGDTTPTFSGAAEDGTTVTLYDGATAIGSTVAIGGVWSITSSTLAQGTHSIAVRATDLAGNVSAASPALAIQVITDVPATRVSDMALSSDTGTSGADFVTNQASQTITGKLDAELAAGERVEISFDGGQTWTVASSDTSTTWSLTTSLASGTHTIAVRVANAVDNGGPMHIQDYTLDTVAPAVTITSDVGKLKVGETATITFTFNEDPGATFTWNGSVGDITVSGGTLSAISGSGLTRTAIFTPDPGVNSGTASITINAGSYSDVASNIGTAGETPSLTFDTKEPAAVTLELASDSGESASDGTTSEGQVNISGIEGDATWEYSTNGGGSWSAGTGTTFTVTAGTYTAGAVQVRQTDATGNVSSVGTLGAVTIDDQPPAPPIFTPAAAFVQGIPENTPIGTVVGKLFSEAGAKITIIPPMGAAFTPFEIDPSDTNPADGYNVILAQAMQVPVGQSVTFYAYAEDPAGNSSAVLGAPTTLNVIAPPSNPNPQPPTPPTPPTSDTVDGVPVQTGTVTNPDGTVSQVVTIPVVVSTRPEEVGNNTVADIPLVKTSTGASLLTAQVPTGYGLQVTGSAVPKTAGTSLTDLIREINAHTEAGSADQNQLTGGGSGFLGRLPADTPLLVQTIVPTVASGASAAPNEPLVISGTPQAAGNPMTALVIDTRGLPSGTHIQLQNVEFAAVIGAVRVTGGEGSQNVWGDSSDQYIVLGADDDVLRGGAGDDVIGSAGGRDLLFGNQGNDVVFGGEGYDRLGGGQGDDQLDGGTGVDVARFGGINFNDATLTYNADGTLTVSGAGIGTDTLQNIELLHFDDRVVLANNPQIPAAPAFDEGYYLAQNPDVAAAVQAGALASGQEHYLKFGAQEGRSPAPQQAVVDEAFYLSQNPDVAAAVAAGAFASGLQHYLQAGAREGRDPNALFDEAWYLQTNADVAAAVEAGSLKSGYEHFARFGWSEGRDPSAWMDVSAYLEANPDVAAANVDPMTHYLRYGLDEGRIIVTSEWDLWA